jgi:hypothetical protein
MADKKPPKKRASNDPDMTKARMDAFIAAYGEVGTIRKAAQAAEISRSTVKHWIRTNLYDFKLKYEASKEVFREYIQDLALEKVKGQGPKDNPVLHITLLNAHWPEKYRRDASAVTNEMKEMMIEWKSWVRTNKKRNQYDRSPAELTEAEEAKMNAIDQVEHILARKKTNDSGTE